MFMTGGWIANSTTLGEWIQADLGSAHLITGMITQGRQNASEWVTEYEVCFILGIVFNLASLPQPQLPHFQY